MDGVRQARCDRELQASGDSRYLPLLDDWARVDYQKSPTPDTRGSAAPAVVMSFDYYSSLMETVHLLSSPANAAHLAKSRGLGKLHLLANARPENAETHQ